MKASEVMPATERLEVSADGKFLAGASTNKIFVRLVELDMVLPIINFFTFAEEVADVVFSTDSSMIAVLLPKKNTVVIEGVEQQLGKLRGKCKGKIQESSTVTAIKWAPDSCSLLLFCDQYKVTIYDLQERQVGCYLRYPKYSGKGCEFSPDRKLMALAERRECKDYLAIYRTEDWKLVNHLPLDLFDLADIRWTPSGHQILAWDSCLNYKMLAVCPVIGIQAKLQPPQEGLGIKSLVCSSDSLFVAMGSHDQRIRLVNCLTWKIIGDMDCLPTSSNSKTVVYLEDETTNSSSIVIASSSKIPVGKQAGSIDKSAAPSNTGITILEFSPSSTYIAAKNDSLPNILWFWNVKTLRLDSVICFSAAAKAFAWHPTEDYLVSCSGTGRLYRWEPHGCRAQPLPEQLSKFQPQELRWHQSKQMILLVDRTGQSVFCVPPA